VNNSYSPYDSLEAFASLFKILLYRYETAIPFRLLIRKEHANCYQTRKARHTSARSVRVAFYDKMLFGAIPKRVFMYQQSSKIPLLRLKGAENHALVRIVSLKS
jgi:hypothetical protein